MTDHSRGVVNLATTAENTVPDAEDAANMLIDAAAVIIAANEWDVTDFTKRLSESHEMLEATKDAPETSYVQ